MRLRALAVGIAILASAVPAARQVPAGQALERYHRGEHEAAVAALNPRELQVATFTASLESWIAAGTQGADQRTLVAASFALDVVWAATRRADDESNVGWSIVLEPQARLRMAGLSADRALVSDLAATLAVVAWGCSQLDARQSRGTTEVTAAEREWWHASVGMLQNAAAWRALEGGPADTEAQKARVLAPADRELVTGHLAHARTRLGEDPQLRLAEALATARFPGRPPGAGRLDVLRDERRTDHRQIAALQQRLRRLADVSGVAAEIAVREGYLDVLLLKYDSAMAHFERARTQTQDPFLVATTDYLSGWVHERSGRPVEAIAAYRRAHAFSPRVRNVSVRLAGLLYLRNEREEAYRILDAGLTTEPPVIDLVTLLNRGDARRVPEYLAAMRKALR
jgi:tetratricopeptide (TPR) repeat protein